MLKPVELLGMFFDAGSGSTVVLMGDRTRDSRLVPILIGPTEAQAIAIVLEGVVLPRPSTHDLFVAVIESMDVSLRRVIVTGLEDGMFLAELELVTRDGDQRVSARPSDGIALAVRTGAEILIEESVLEEAGIEVERSEEQPVDSQQVESIVADFQDFLATAEPADFEVTDEDDTP